MSSTLCPQCVGDGQEAPDGCTNCNGSGYVDSLVKVTAFTESGEDKPVRLWLTGLFNTELVIVGGFIYPMTNIVEAVEECALYPSMLPGIPYDYYLAQDGPTAPWYVVKVVCNVSGTTDDLPF
jgi:hypothetical protein